MAFLGCANDANARIFFEIDFPQVKPVENLKTKCTHTVLYQSLKAKVWRPSKLDIRDIRVLFTL